MHAPPPPFLAIRHLEVGGAHFKAPCGRNLIPPLLCTSPTLRRVFGGWQVGVYEMWPVTPACIRLTMIRDNSSVHKVNNDQRRLCKSIPTLQPNTFGLSRAELPCLDHIFTVKVRDRMDSCKCFKSDLVAKTGSIILVRGDHPNS